MRFSQIFSLLDSRIIKIIAAITMTVDHIGLILFPDIVWLRYIGRISFPLFAFLIAYGCTKTRNIGRYFLRLIAFAVWLQIIWVFAGFIDAGIAPELNNIFFTLAFGAGAVWLVKFLRTKFSCTDFVDRALFVLMSVLVVLLVAVVGGWLRVDYGTEGVLLIPGFFAMINIGALFNKSGAWALVFRLLAAPAVLALYNLLFSVSAGGFTYQWYSMLAAVFICLFADKKLRAHWLEKYSFYLYYPIHFAVLYLIAIL
jgi:hypothetical protein